MSKGIRLEKNTLRRIRLLEYRKYEELKELTKTFAVVYSNLGDGMKGLEFLKKYQDMVFPPERDLEDIIEENRLMIEEEAKKSYLVKPKEE